LKIKIEKNNNPERKIGSFLRLNDVGQLCVTIFWQTWFLMMTMMILLA
jgi:hypothetical protein